MIAKQNFLQLLLYLINNVVRIQRRSPCCKEQSFGYPTHVRYKHQIYIFEFNPSYFQFILHPAIYMSTYTIFCRSFSFNVFFLVDLLKIFVDTHCIFHFCLRQIRISQLLAIQDQMHDNTCFIAVFEKSNYHDGVGTLICHYMPLSSIVKCPQRIKSWNIIFRKL